MYLKHISRIIFPTLLLMLSYSKSAYSKGFITWLGADGKSVHRVSLMSGENIVLRRNHIDTLESYVLEYEGSAFTLDVSGHLFDIAGRMLATFGGSGKVFEVDTTNKVVRRIDQTIYSGYNFGAYQFERNDTIFSFGGYGFWTENNNLTFYSDNRSEWSLYDFAPFPPQNPDDGKRNRALRFYDPSIDALFVSFENRIFQFSFREHLWSEQGHINEELLLNGEFMAHAVSDTSTLLFTGLRTYLLIPKRNEVYDVTMSNGLNLHSNGAKTKFGFSCGYEFGNRLLLPKTSDKVEVGYIFESVPLKFDPSRPKLNLWNKRYISFNGYFYVVLISLALLAVVLTFWIRERFKNRKSTVFTEEQRAFLVSLSSEPMRTEALNELLGLLESSWEIQRRKRSDFIKALNEQGLNSLGKEIILREKSIEDKRQVLYVLNEEVRSELARLM